MLFYELAARMHGCAAAPPLLTSHARSARLASHPSIGGGRHPWELASVQAFHGGTFRVGFAMQIASSLGVPAALLLGARAPPVPRSA